VNSLVKAVNILKAMDPEQRKLAFQLSKSDAPPRKKPGPKPGTKRTTAAKPGPKKRIDATEAE